MCICCATYSISSRFLYFVPFAISFLLIFSPSVIHSFTTSFVKHFFSFFSFLLFFLLHRHQFLGFLLFISSFFLCEFPYCIERKKNKRRQRREAFQSEAKLSWLSFISTSSLVVVKGKQQFLIDTNTLVHTEDMK